MSDRFQADIPIKDITPPELFFKRREFIKQSLALGGLAGIQGMCSPRQEEAYKPEEILKIDIQRPAVFPAKRNEAFELPAGAKGPVTQRLVAATHNNFYEFLPGRGGPVFKFVDQFTVDPWKIEVRGECDHPMTLDLDDLFGFEHQERLYHFRCVERWAMNIPWSGFPLSKLIEKAQPNKNAKYVRFLSANRPEQMPGMAQASYYEWPYFEALRLDEAMNPLAMLVTGVYGAPLPKQHGAPARIIVPWKYGFKNPKSIVKIEFVREQPSTFWMIQPHEYGFISNINPNIPHPRWSQERSYWLGSEEWFPTPLFNGYEKYVAHLYPDEPRTPQTPLRSGQIAR